MFELEGTFAWQASASGDLAAGRHWPGRASQLLDAVPARARRRVHQARSTAPKWIWGVPLLLALSVVLVNVETPRFREPVDPFLILLAAAGRPGDGPGHG